MLRPDGLRHPDAGALSRLLEGEGHPDELAATRAHASACAACRAEVDRLRRRSARFTALVGEIELPAGFVFPEPPGSAGRGVRPSTRAALGSPARWLRAAAVVVIVLVPLLAVSPLRATIAEWIADRWSQVVALARPGAGDAAATTGTAVEEPHALLWFAPAGSELRIEIASRQQAGRVVLQSSNAPEASLRIVGGSGEENPTVSDRALRIQNHRASTATYEVGVPRGVRRVVLQVGGGPPLAVERGGLERGRSFPLGDRPE